MSQRHSTESYRFCSITPKFNQIMQVDQSVTMPQSQNTAEVENSNL